jgi:hypothetical protein
VYDQCFFFGNFSQQDEAPEQSNHQRKPSVLQKAGRWVRTRLGRGRGDGDPEADPVSDPADDAEYFLEKLALGASAQEMEGGGGSRGRCLCCASGKVRCCPRAIDPSKPFHYRVSDRNPFCFCHFCSSTARNAVSNTGHQSNSRDCLLFVAHKHVK